MEQTERGEIGRRIRVLRRERQLSIQRLAELAGMSPGYLSEVERGGSAPSGEKLARIAQELGVTTDYLFTGTTGVPAAVQVPAGLAAAAEHLDLSYAQTMRLLAGRQSLVARRASGDLEEWNKEEWISFYGKVKDYL